MDRDNDTPDAARPDRRRFLAGAATTAMAGGLTAGYGAFAYMAGRYLYPSQEEGAWMFVAAVDRLAPGEAFPFRSPAGVPVVITRKAMSAANEAPSEDDELPTADDFLALSSVCPHLGCRVHWEPHNDRFFCPCHNGVFDPQGTATAGPPADENQKLPEYPLKIDGGLLYIYLPAAPLV